MYRCPRFVVAALIVLGSFCAVRQRVFSGEESLQEEAVSLEALPAESEVSESVESRWLWPPTWELQPGFTLRVRGRLDTDAIWSSQSAANKATFGDQEDVVGLRRARIGVEGEYRDNPYVAEIDLASGNVVPRDIYMGFGRRQEEGEARTGHFREPFSLEGGTSARQFPFLERSPVNLLDPARSWGLAWFRANPDTNTAWALGLFQAGTGDWDFQGGEGSTVGLTGRLTKALVNENNGERLLHLGLALSARWPENGVIIINQQPRSPLLNLEDSSRSAFMPIIRIPASSEQLINLQFAAAHGPLWTQAEWYGSFIDQTGGGEVFFRGCHFDGGYFITGEHRNYDSSTGTLSYVRVQRPWLNSLAADDRPQGWGAWELTARYSYLNFVDPDTPRAPSGQQIGVQLQELRIGLNWYLADRVQWMFNYAYLVPDEVNTGQSAASIFSTRLAVFW
jgi:phosphate-selective porin OprO/OprP